MTLMSLDVTAENVLKAIKKKKGWKCGSCRMNWSHDLKWQDRDSNPDSLVRNRGSGLPGFEPNSLKRIIRHRWQLIFVAIDVCLSSPLITYNNFVCCCGSPVGRACWIKVSCWRCYTTNLGSKPGHGIRWCTNPSLAKCRVKVCKCVANKKYLTSCRLAYQRYFC